MRCSNLAKALRSVNPDQKIRFAGRFDGFAQSILRLSNFEAIEVNDLAKLSEVMPLPSLVFWDSYELTQTQLDWLAKQPFQVACFDDFHTLDLGGMDLVINFTVGAVAMGYDAKRSLLGSHYLPVRPELVPIRECNLSRPVPVPRNLLVLMGGSDRSGLRPKLLPVLADVFPQASITYLSDEPLAGFDQPPFHSVPFRLEVEHYYEPADLVISGGGLAKYEAAFCAIPNATFSQTRDQQSETDQFAALGLTLDLGLAEHFEAKKAIAGLRRLAEPETREAQRAASLENFRSDSPILLAQALIKRLASH